MPRVERVYNRDDLYALVWSKTMREAAKAYGISDVALKKICRKLDVPTPPQGYWLRLAAGRDAVRAALPNLRQGASPDLVTVTYQENMPIALPSDAATQRAALEMTSNRIEVAPTLVEPHRLVARTTKLLSRAKPFDGLVAARSRSGLDVAVAPTNVDRAMRIMDALLKAIGERGLSIEVTPTSEEKVWGRSVHVDPITRVRVDGEWINFSMSETVKIAPPPKDPPKRRSDMTWDERWKTPWEPPERRVRTPTGTLVLTIETGAHSRHWRDRAHRRLETFLNDFIAHLYVASDWVKQERKRREEKQREAEQAERDRVEAARRAAEEKKRVEDLHATLEKWRLVRDLRDFASSIRGIVGAGSMKVTPGAPLHEYLSFVAAYADRIDPLRALREELKEHGARE